MKRENSILNWGYQRGITVTTPENRMKRVSSQCKKLRQEYEEMLTDDDKDSLGDQLVVLSMIAGILGSTASLARYAVREILPKEGSLKSNIGQCLNSLEWMVEISQDPEHNNSVEILKEVGYYVDALERYAESKGWSLQECVEVAWEDIKDRKGALIHEIFVKEANLAILETYGVIVKDHEGELLLEGIVDIVFYDAVLDEFDKLGYDYDSEDWSLDHKMVYTTGTI